MNSTIDVLDGYLQSFLSEADLNINELKCGLNHGIDLEENPLAIDYLCQRFSKKDEGDFILQIPICSECIVSLYSEYQLLFICVSCTSSQWVYRPDSKINYSKNTNIIFFKECPKCYHKKYAE